MKRDNQRAQERAAEDAQYAPVIVKRTDEVRRHPDDILETAVREGEEQLVRAAPSLCLSATARLESFSHPPSWPLPLPVVGA